jgi:hypothetical protein
MTAEQTGSRIEERTTKDPTKVVASVVEGEQRRLRGQWSHGRSRKGGSM